MAYGMTNVKDHWHAAAGDRGADCIPLSQAAEDLAAKAQEHWDAERFHEAEVAFSIASYRYAKVIGGGSFEPATWWALLNRYVVRHVSMLDSAARCALRLQHLKRFEQRRIRAIQCADAYLRYKALLSDTVYDLRVLRDGLRDLSDLRSRPRKDP